MVSVFFSLTVIYVYVMLGKFRTYLVKTTNIYIMSKFSTKLLISGLSMHSAVVVNLQFGKSAKVQRVQKIGLV